jgi:hypothetical protein
MVVSFPAPAKSPRAIGIRPEITFQGQPITVIQVHETCALISGPDYVGSEKRQRIAKLEYLEPRPAANS